MRIVDRLSAACPVCDAGPGQRCRALNQTSYVKLRSKPHSQRQPAVVESTASVRAKARTAMPGVSWRDLPDLSGPHGTESRYSGGCRCPECRTGHAAYCRAHRRGLPDGDPRHGTLTGYNGHGCRCHRCREANHTYAQALRQRDAAAGAYGRQLRTAVTA